jgi:hypothetical protein
MSRFGGKPPFRSNECTQAGFVNVDQPSTNSEEIHPISFHFIVYVAGLTNFHSIDLQRRMRFHIIFSCTQNCFCDITTQESPVRTANKDSRE